MPQIVCMGEVLIDFVALERDTSVGYADRFQKAAGGAPANVAVGLARLGIEAAFISQVGDDPFGHYLEETLRLNAVDTSGITFSRQARTMLAFVSVEASGERSFAFYRHPSADMLMTPEMLNHGLLRQTTIFHFGSITLSSEPVCTATLAAVEAAKSNGALISYDPNLRPALWSSLDEAKNGLLLGLHHANIVKMNEEELSFLNGGVELKTVESMVTACRQLWHDDLQLLVITRGPQGCLAVTPQNYWVVEGFNVMVEDTIGAGDGFMAGLLSGLLPNIQTGYLADLDEATLLPILRRANAVGALTTMRRGGIPALPTLLEVEVFLKG